LISHVKPEDYVPVSLTTVCTPHRGSPFMDWCMDNIGIGKPRNKALAAERLAASLPDPPPSPPTSQFTLSNLPSSFTTLLLDLIDSPAYSNLTTSYLQNVFNPATPDDPNVKYYSVAARTNNINIWHPLWLPKMVLDGVEERQKAEEDRRQQRITSSPLQEWETDDWGNDGLVSVRSAKWGEFLGTLDGCDHWEVRGSRGLGVDWTVDFGLSNVVKSTLPSIITDSKASADSGRGEAWSWRDWGRFVGAWRQEEDKRERRQGRSAPPALSASADGDDDVVKSSTDKLSAVFDWISEQAPGSTPPAEKISKYEMEKKRRETRAQKDPRPKFDLESFYVALTRKLYDDGL